MTPTNNAIYTSLITILNNAALGYQVSYPGYNFSPPSTGVWLEVMFFPNRGIDYDTGNTDDVTPQGNFQVSVHDRPGSGIDDIDTAVQSVMAIFPKGTRIEDSVRVYRPAYVNELDPESDRMTKIVTIPYSG